MNKNLFGNDKGEIRKPQNPGHEPGKNPGHNPDKSPGHQKDHGKSDKGQKFDPRPFGSL